MEEVIDEQARQVGGNGQGQDPQNACEEAVQGRVPLPIRQGHPTAVDARQLLLIEDPAAHIGKPPLRIAVLPEVGNRVLGLFPTGAPSFRGGGLHQVGSPMFGGLAIVLLLLRLGLDGHVPLGKTLYLDQGFLPGPVQAPTLGALGGPLAEPGHQAPPLEHRGCPRRGHGLGGFPVSGLVGLLQAPDPGLGVTAHPRQVVRGGLQLVLVQLHLGPGDLQLVLQGILQRLPGRGVLFREEGDELLVGLEDRLGLDFEGGKLLEFGGLRHLGARRSP